MEFAPKLMGHKFCAALLLLTLASAELRLPRSKSKQAPEVRRLEGCRTISFAELCELPALPVGCFQLQPSDAQPGTGCFQLQPSDAQRCELRGPHAAPARLVTAENVTGVATLRTQGELRITGSIQMISLRFDAGTLVFDDAQVEAWHEDHPDELIDQGGAFSSRGPFTLTNSYLTVRDTSAVKGGGLAAVGNLTLANSTLRVVDASATDYGGGFYSKAVRLQLDSTVFMENISARDAAGFYVEGDVNVSENSSIFMRNATAMSTGGGFLARGAVTLAAGRLHLRGTTAEQTCGGFSAGGPLKVINRSTISIRHASAGSSGGGFIALNDVVIAEMSNLSISNVSAWEFGGFVARGLQVNNSTVSIQHAGSLKGRAGGFGTVGGPVEIVNSSTVSIQHAKAALTGGGLFSFDDLVIAEMSNLSMSNVSAGAGGGFYAQKALRVNHSTVSIQHATAAGGVLFNALKTLEGSGGGFLVGKSVQIVNSSTVSIQHARTSQNGGGFAALSDVVIAEMSKVSLSNVSANEGGGFHVDGRLQVINSSTLSVQNARAGISGGGFLAQKDVNITGMSKVEISDSQAVFGHGGGFVPAKGLQLTEGSAIFIENATAGGKGGAAYSEGNVVINSSNVSIQNATAGTHGGGFHFGGLNMYNGFMVINNSQAKQTSSGGFVDNRALLTSQSQLVVRHAKGNNSAVLTADCLHIHPGSAFLMDNVKGGHAVMLQNNDCSSDGECSKRTLQVKSGGALNATGHLSLAFLSVAACPNETVHLSGISWSSHSPLLRHQRQPVEIDDVSIHYQPPLQNLLINCEAGATCTACAQGVTLNATNHMLQALSPKDRQCPSKVTVSRDKTSPCDCPTHQIIKANFRGNESVALKDLFATCQSCHNHSYYDNGTCRKCGVLWAWSDGKSDKCHWLPRENWQLACLLMGGAIIVFLAFVLFEILISPLVVVDATSDPLEIASEKVFTITAQGPIVGLPTYLSRIVHWLVSYRVEGTSLQWLDFDKKSKNTVKVRSIGNGKLQLQDVYVPFDCAACKGVMHATKTFPLFAVLAVFISVVVLVPVTWVVAAMSENGFGHVLVTAFYCFLPTAVAAAVLHLPVACLVGWFYRRTPFSAALNEYHKHIQCKPHLGRDATHPRNQGLMALTLQDLGKHFERFILERNMHFVVANIVRPLTCNKRESFVTLWGGQQVDYFVSHSWGTSFSHFVRSIRSHAMSKGGQTWTDATYWICSFANNQWDIEAELGTDPMDSAFARALTGGIKGVVMVLDQQVQPLTRVWCLFEFFLSSREHLELDFGTDAGVIGDDGCTSFDIALEVGRRIKSLQVVNCETSSEKDKQDIFDYIVSELGSLERMDEQIRSLIGNMLKKNLSNVGHATETLLLELGQI